ncbi:MAG: PhzF family phenazine biosynthesis protein [Nocardioidaceae bacterium]
MSVDGAPRMLAYDVVDVFTETAFAGNPLAVVHGAEGLSDAQLQAIAGEFNLSETTFPAVAPNGPANLYSVRIFTPGGEIPFAGHPTLGTAWVLRQQGRLAAGTVVQRCGVGDIEVRVPELASDLTGLAATPRDLIGPIDPRPVAEAVGLPASAVTGDVMMAGCGLGWVHLPVATDALAHCRPGAALADVLPGGADDVLDPGAGVNVFSAAPGPASLDVRSRVFCPDVSGVEDPATGSAAAGLGVALVATGALPSGGGFTVRQGVEMGRPSTLYGHVTTEIGRTVRCEVAGGVVAVASGTIAVPEV